MPCLKLLGLLIILYQIESGWKLNQMKFHSWFCCCKSGSFD